MQLISTGHKKGLHPGWPLLSMECNTWCRHEGKSGNRVEMKLHKTNKIQIKIISFHNNSQAGPCLRYVSAYPAGWQWNIPGTYLPSLRLSLWLLEVLWSVQKPLPQLCGSRHPSVSLYQQHWSPATVTNNTLKLRELGQNCQPHTMGSVQNFLLVLASPSYHAIHGGINRAVAQPTVLP